MMLRSLFNFIVVKPPWFFFQNFTQYIYQLQYVIIIWLLRDLLGQARGQEPIKFIALMFVF